MVIDNEPGARGLVTAINLKAHLVFLVDDPDAFAEIETWAGDAGMSILFGCTDDVGRDAWALNPFRSKERWRIPGAGAAY